MKKIIILICFIIGLSEFGNAQNINGRFSSSVYMFRRYDTVNVYYHYVSAYQMLNLNINQGRFSLRSFMNLESDLAQTIDSNPNLKFYNLYLEVRDILDVANVKLGRQPLFNSAVGGLFDGLTVDLKKDNYKLSAYYGGNVPEYETLKLTDNWNDNFILGGKLSTDVLNNFLFSLSYINKNFQPTPYYATRLDASLNPITVLIENNSSQFQFASAEVQYNLPNEFSVISHYDYDLNYDRTSKFELDGNYSPSEKVGLDFYYNFRNPMIRYNSIFSVFDYGNTQEFEVGANYKINNLFTLNGRFGDVIYRDDNASRVTLGVSSNYGSFSYRKTFGYAGELDAVSLYTAYTFLKGLLTPSLGVSYTKYKLSPDASSNDLASVLAGVNIRPLPMLSFDLQGQYMDNKIYKNDFRAFLKLNYWFNTNL